MIRINPDTGAAWPTNPWATDPDLNRARIIAYGFRNPFRMTVDPVKNFVGDVGWGSWEELNTVDLSDQSPPNFGWPCFEAVGRQPLYDEAHVPLCDSLTSSETKSPSFAYTPNDMLAGGCMGSGQSITGIAVVRNNNYPSPYNNGIYMADYARQCIIFAPRATDGTYNFGALRTIATGVAAVDLRVGPGGYLYYVDSATSTIQRISPTGTNHAPVADVTASPAFGPLPLHVALDATGSSDLDAADQSQLTYQWDLDDDGQYDDGSGAVISTIFASAGSHRVGLRVTDTRGASAIADTTVLAGISPPVPVIDLPAAATIAPGTFVDFAGHATDVQDGNVAASDLHWTLLLQHCDTPLSCHVHQIGDSDGNSGGQFQMPSHPSPSFLDVVLTATDSGGASDSTSVRLTIGS